MTHRQWYYHLNGQTVGPISKDQFAQLFRSGRLPPETPVWAEGIKDWVPAFKVKGLLPEPAHDPIDDYLTPPPTPARQAAQAGDSVAIILENPPALHRLAAAILDGFIMYLAGTVLEVVVQVFTGGNTIEHIRTVSVLSIILYWLYYALMESSSLQGTVGKMLLGFAVTDLRGKRISFWRATARYFAKILSVITLGIGYAMCLWTEDKQCLHDMVSGCIMYQRR